MEGFDFKFIMAVAVVAIVAFWIIRTQMLYKRVEKLERKFAEMKSGVSEND